MNYQKFRPCEILHPFVECYFVWESEEKVEGLVVESPPHGFCSMVFNFGDEYFLTNKKHEKLQVPRQFISGQSIYSYKLFLNGIISIIGIVFKAAALATLFSLPVYAYTEERIPLYNVFEKHVVDSIVNKLQAANNNNEKVRLLEEFVLMSDYKTKPQPDWHCPRRW